MNEFVLQLLQKLTHHHKMRKWFVPRGTIFKPIFYDTLMQWMNQFVDWITGQQGINLWKHKVIHPWKQCLKSNDNLCDPSEAVISINTKCLSKNEKKIMAVWRKHELLKLVQANKYRIPFIDSWMYLTFINDIIPNPNVMEITQDCITCGTSDISIFQGTGNTCNCIDSSSSDLRLYGLPTDQALHLMSLYQVNVIRWKGFEQTLQNLSATPLCSVIPRVTGDDNNPLSNIKHINPYERWSSQIRRACFPQVLFRNMLPRRDYQECAIRLLQRDGVHGSVVLPCGSGKTMIGLHKIGYDLNTHPKLHAMIVCHSVTMCHTWKKQIARFTNIPLTAVCILDEKQLTAETIAETRIYCSTYNRLTTQLGSRHTKSLQEYLCNQDWCCRILDEVHLVRGKEFRRVSTMIQGIVHNDLGLTATLCVEDNQDISAPFDNILYYKNQQDIRQENPLYLSRIYNYFLQVPLQFHSSWNINFSKVNHDPFRLSELLGLNPALYQVADDIISCHQDCWYNRTKVIVACDNLTVLKLFATWYNYTHQTNYPLITGTTTADDREDHFRRFVRPEETSILFTSTIVDIGIDLPPANVLIQLRHRYNSKVQPIQRIGRISRPKLHDNNAFHYVLVNDYNKEYKFAQNMYKNLQESYEHVEWRKCTPWTKKQEQEFIQKFKIIKGRLKYRIDMLHNNHAHKTKTKRKRQRYKKKNKTQTQKQTTRHHSKKRKT